MADRGSPGSNPLTGSRTVTERQASSPSGVPFMHLKGQRQVSGNRTLELSRHFNVAPRADAGNAMTESVATTVR